MVPEVLLLALGPDRAKKCCGFVLCMIAEGLGINLDLGRLSCSVRLIDDFLRGSKAVDWIWSQRSLRHLIPVSLECVALSGCA